VKFKNKTGVVVKFRRGVDVIEVAPEMEREFGPDDEIEILDGPYPTSILRTGDSIGKLKAVIAHPDGTVRNVVFDAERPVTVPQGFRCVQVGHIGSNVKLDSPNDSPGAMIANGLRRFNQNVMREPEFKATVSDEVNSTEQVVQASTVWVAFGAPGNRHRFQITVERTDREPPPVARSTPLVIQEGE
jgi:hypothetical protein